MKEKILKALYVIGLILFIAVCIFLAMCVGYYRWAKFKFFMGW
jgi:hypothetical protein